LPVRQIGGGQKSNMPGFEIHRILARGFGKEPDSVSITGGKTQENARLLRNMVR
jgi:hypothetical protein